MNVIRIYLTLVFAFALSISAYSQDLHFSQYFNSPLNLSPGLTGVFNGDYRLVGNYKSQWKNVPVDYMTFSGAFDIKLDQYGSDKGNFNLGVLFDYDTAGDLDLSLTNLALLGSYNLRVSEKSFLTPGVSIGFNQRRLKPGNARTGSQWNGFEFDPSLPAEIPALNNNSFMDVALGANYRYQKEYRKFFDLGLGLNHLFTPSQSFEENPNYEAKLQRRWNIYAMINYALGSRFDLILNGLHQNQSPHRETVLNVQGKIYFNKNSDRDIALHLGVGTRLGDSWYPMIAIQYRRLYASVNYDFTTSDFSAKADGGLELHVMYRFSKVPPVNFKPCPIY